MISVVIPAFNEAKVISECLESLKKQDYKGDYEVIVVDNGSKDNTAKIAQEYGARVVHCPLKGVSYARQAGAEAASGQIIAQADADTTYPSWWLTRLQKQFDSHPKHIAVAGTFIYKRPPWWAGFEYLLRALFNILSALVFRRPYIISGANFAFYKIALLQIGGYDQSSYSSDQFNISSRLSKVGKIFFDRKSWCATDERSVAKPTIVIIFAFIQNLSYFAKHILISLGALLNRQFKKMTSTSTKTYVKITIPVLLISLLCYGYFVPASPVFGRVYFKAAAQGKVIALTFDDGPNDPYTSRVLDILEANDVRATFFLIGANVKTYPETVRRMVIDGDIIGNHTYSHNANHALSFLAYKDIQEAENTIFEVTGLRPHLYRPPHGKKSPWELQSVRSEGHIEVLWSIATNELNGRTPDVMASDIIKKANPGSIILLHDGYGTTHDSGRAIKQDTVEALSIIVPRLKAEGYQFVTIPELLNVPAYDQVSK